MNTHSLIDRLLEIPKEIESLQKELVNSTRGSQEILNQIVKCETKIRVLIAGLTDDAGKKQYSNEDARRAAFAEMAEDDLELNELKTQSAALENWIQLKRVEYELLSNEQKNIRAVLTFLSSKENTNL